MTGKWRELAQIRKKRAPTTSCSGVNMALCEAWSLLRQMVDECTFTSYAQILWSVFCADQWISNSACPFTRRLLAKKGSVPRSPQGDSSLRRSGTCANPGKQRAGAVTFLPSCHVEMISYISTKAYVIHCSSVQKASFISSLPCCTAPGKSTVIKSAQSLAHLQQLIWRQRAQHST